MEGLPLDVVLLVAVAVVGVVLAVAYVSRKLGSNQVCKFDILRRRTHPPQPFCARRRRVTDISTIQKNQARVYPTPACVRSDVHGETLLFELVSLLRSQQTRPETFSTSFESIRSPPPRQRAVIHTTGSPKDTTSKHACGCVQAIHKTVVPFLHLST